MKYLIAWLLTMILFVLAGMSNTATEGNLTDPQTKQITLGNEGQAEEETLAIAKVDVEQYVKDLRKLSFQEAVTSAEVSLLSWLLVLLLEIAIAAVFILFVLASLSSLRRYLGSKAKG